MSPRYFLLAGFCSLVFSSCQSSRTAFRSTTEPTASSAVLLVHDSQSPEPTVVPVSEVEISRYNKGQQKR